MPSALDAALPLRDLEDLALLDEVEARLLIDLNAARLRGDALAVSRTHARLDALRALAALFD